MTHVDKELLTLAALAAYAKATFVGDMLWNPIEKDSDAHDLAAILGKRQRFEIQIFPDRTTVTLGVSSNILDVTEFNANHIDSSAATRMAIVKAAAEIGKTL